MILPPGGALWSSGPQRQVVPTAVIRSSLQRSPRGVDSCWPQEWACLQRASPLPRAPRHPLPSASCSSLATLDTPYSLLTSALWGQLCLLCRGVLALLRHLVYFQRAGAFPLHESKKLPSWSKSAFQASSLLGLVEENCPFLPSGRSSVSGCPSE